MCAHPDREKYLRLLIEEVRAAMALEWRRFRPRYRKAVQRVGALVNEPTTLTANPAAPTVRLAANATNR